MILFCYIIFWLIVVGVPFAIAAIVFSAKTYGFMKATLLPVSIVNLALTILCVVGLFQDDLVRLCGIVFIGTLIISFVTLSAAEIHRRDVNNKMYDDRKKEHEEAAAKRLAELSN